MPRHAAGTRGQGEMRRGAPVSTEGRRVPGTLEHPLPSLPGLLRCPTVWSACVPTHEGPWSCRPHPSPPHPLGVLQSCGWPWRQGRRFRLRVSPLSGSCYSYGMGVISLGQPSKSPRQLSSHLQLSQDTVSFSSSRRAPPLPGRSCSWTPCRVPWLSDCHHLLCPGEAPRISSTPLGSPPSLVAPGGAAPSGPLTAQPLCPAVRPHNALHNRVGRCV